MGNFGISNISRPSLSIIVADELIQQINAGNFGIGDELPSESQLADSFGVSKPVVREALSELRALGIIEITQGKPAKVCEVSVRPMARFLRVLSSQNENGLTEAMGLRRLLETEIVGLAASRITDTELESLRFLVDSMRTQEHDHDEWVELDSEFHMRIAKASRNRLMLYLVEVLRGVLWDTIYTLRRQWTVEELNNTVQRHQAVLDALKERDPEAARCAMDEHFRATNLSRG